MACSLLRGQDLNWSQPQNAVLYQNPAFTALETKFSANLNFRDQWSVINKAYRSYMFSGDYRFDKSNKRWFGLGATVIKDQQGLNSYKTTSGALNLSCILRLNARTRFSVGLGGNFAQNSLYTGDYTWGSQYNGEKYDESLASGESKGSFSRSYADVHAGIALSYDNEENVFLGENRKKWLFGYSIYHIARPNVSMTGGKDNLQMKHTGFLKGYLSLDEKYTLIPVLYGYYQGNMRQVTVGSLLRVGTENASKITEEKKAAAFSFGLLYRVKDAIIPTIEAEKGTFVFALSYDATVSQFRKADKFRGGIELSIRIRSFGTSDKIAETIHTGKKFKGTNTSTVRRKKKRFSLF